MGSHTVRSGGRSGDSGVSSGRDRSGREGHARLMEGRACSAWRRGRRQRVEIRRHRRLQVKRSGRMAQKAIYICGVRLYRLLEGLQIFGWCHRGRAGPAKKSERDREQRKRRIGRKTRSESETEAETGRVRERERAMGNRQPFVDRTVLCC
jgi:hypothetical protein